MTDSAETMRVALEHLVSCIDYRAALHTRADIEFEQFQYADKKVWQAIDSAKAALSASGTKSDGTAGKDADPQRNRLLGEDTPEQGAGVAPGPSDPIPSQPSLPSHVVAAIGAVRSRDDVERLVRDIITAGETAPIPSQPDEREACEEVARSFGELYALKTETGAMMFRAVTDKIADAIRARGQV